MRHAPAPDVTASDRSAVLLLSHGSRDPRAEDVVEELVLALAAGTGGTVRAAHLQFTAPTPVVALRQLAVEGFTSVRIVPLLFTPGYHTSHDVPVAVKASFATRGMHVSVAPPLLAVGRSGRGLLLKALTDRLAQAGAAPDVDALVLASAGSSSDSARHHIKSLARDLAQAHGIPVAYAFASASPPSITQALEALSDRGIQRPAVVSLFVAPGRLADSVVAACPDLPVAGPLGVSPAFVELLVSQARTMSPAL